MNIFVIVEIPKFSHQKYEFDEELKMIKLDRTLFSPVYFPFEYGFIKETKGKDGDPLDVILLSNFPTFPGCLIEARPIGLLWMEDEAGIDNKVIAVPGDKIDPRFKEFRNVNDLRSHARTEIQEFFRTYKKLERGKWVKIKGLGPRKEAESMIKEARERFKKESQ